MTHTRAALLAGLAWLTAASPFAPAPALPPGFRHWEEAIPPEEERALLEACAALDFAGRLEASGRMSDDLQRG